MIVSMLCENVRCTRKTVMGQIRNMERLFDFMIIDGWRISDTGEILCPRCAAREVGR